MSIFKIDLQDISETRKKINVNIPVEEIAGIESQVLKRFQREAKLPGFRPGKSPENLIRTRYAKELKSELSRQVLTKAYQEGVSKSDLEVFSVVESDGGEIASGAEATIAFVVDVIQEFEIPKYDGFKISVASTEATAEEIDKTLDHLLNQRAEYNVVEKAAEKGDYVRCSYEGKIGDQLISELVPDAPIWGTQKSTWEEAGAEQTPGVKAIVDGLIGMKADDAKQVTMEFPDDFKPEALAGKTATYSLEVEEVREKILPKLDESFFKAIQVKDEADLRERIAKDIENQKQQHNSQLERQQVTELLLKSVDFQIPESGIEGERNSLLHDFMQRNMQQGASQEDFESQKEELYEKADKAARDRIKSRIILGKIAEKEKVQADNEDFGRMIMQEAQQSGQKPEKLVKEIQKDQNRLNRMRNEIILGKTMQLIIEKSEREVVVPNANAANAANA